MYRITSQLCEVFNCTEQRIIKKGILDEFRAWLEDHPEYEISTDPNCGEMINGEIAAKFYEAYSWEDTKTGIG